LWTIFPRSDTLNRKNSLLSEINNTKERLADAALGQRYLAEAPLGIVVVSDTRRSKPRYGRRGEEFYSIVDGAFAAMLLMLACINEGLGAAFVGAFDDEAVRAVVQLPKVVRPIGIICIGYCAEKGEKLSRLPKASRSIRIMNDQSK
jgi:nitroreductase